MTDQLDDDITADVVDPVIDATPLGESARRKRVTKWDRPPDPHDWRYFVGGLGKILITIGLLMFGFVAYQLWGTGIETARAQGKLEDEFAQIVAENQTEADVDQAPATVAPPTTSGTTSDITPATAPPATQPAVVGSPTPPTTAPSEAASASLPPTVQQDIPPIERGRPIAKLEIPRIGKTGGDALYVVPGVSHEDLKKGPGHYSDTPLPGQLGNASIAGHRTTFGEPFRHIDELEPGDEIIVTMASGDRFVYQVTGTQIVEASDYWIVTTTDPTIAELTLTSCHPVYTARQRIAVKAVLVPDESAPVGVATYYDLEGQGADENDAVVTPDSTVGTSAVDGSSVDSGAAAVDAGSESANDSGLSSTPVADAGDAFEGGWFHDKSAWPQIVLWGAVLLVIAYVSGRISRHFRRYSVGIAVAVIPFVIGLYFFYQNVNRLLPPGL